MFWESILSHTHACFLLYSMLWGKISKNQVFSLISCFFQNFDWSNLIFDQSKSCFKNYVSLCLVQLIEPVFSINRTSCFSFFKKGSLIDSNLFQKFFSNFSSLSDLARLHYKFFVVFFLNVCKVFLPQSR